MSYQEGTEAMKTPGSPASSQPATPGLPIQLLPDRPELVVSTNQDPSNSTTPLEPLSPASPTYSEPYSPGFTTHSRPETSGQPKTSRSDLEPKPARCFTRSTVFSIEREAYNYTSLDAALIQMFRAPSDLDLDNAEALEYTLSTEPVGRRSAEVHDPSFDTVSGVALKTAIDNIVNESIANGKTDNWLECAEFGGFWSEETAESDSKVEPSEKVKIRVVEILKGSENRLKPLLENTPKAAHLINASLAADFEIASGTSIIKSEAKPAIVVLRIPYLDARGIPGERNGLSCQEYNANAKGLGRINPAGLDYGNLSFKKKQEQEGTEVGICQAWITTVNKRLIIFYAGNNNTQNQKLSLVVPYQDRIGAYPTMAHTIANILCQSDQRLVEHFRKELSELRMEITAEAMLAMENSDPNKQADTSQAVELYRRAATAEAQLMVLHGMTLQQIEILKELVDFFNLATFDQNKRYTQDWVFINGVSQCGEQIRPTLLLLGETKSKREELSRKLEDIQGSFRVLTVELIQRLGPRKLADEIKATTTAISEGFKSMSSRQMQQRDAIVAQTKQQEVLNDEIYHQGQGISIFTVISTVFLPLGFFCSYFAMVNQDLKDGDQNGNGTSFDAKEFWIPTGIVTGFFTFFSLYFVLVSRFEGRRFINWLIDLFVTALPPSRQDLSQTEIYLRLLPRYHVVLESASVKDDKTTTIRRYLAAPKPLKLTKHAAKGSILRWLPFGEAHKPLLVTSFEKEPQVPQPDDGDEIHGTFRYDNSRGWLYLHKAEPLYNLMYRAHCSSKPGKQAFVWKSGHKQMDHEPFRFRPHFRVEKDVVDVQDNSGTKRLQLKWVTQAGGKLPWWTAKYRGEGLEETEFFNLIGTSLVPFKVEAGVGEKYRIYLELITESTTTMTAHTVHANSA